MPRLSKSAAAKTKEASRLRALREAMGFTQTQMAKEFKVTRNAISFWERAERTIPGPVIKLMEMYEKNRT